MTLSPPCDAFDMTTDVQFRDEYSGEVDGKTVASFYRAFNDDDQPYCILLHDYGIAITQQPSITGWDPDDDDQTPEEHVASDRESAVDWVDALTELVWKAREYDEMMQAVFESEEVAPYPFAELPAVNLLDNPAFGDLTDLTNSVVAVDRLTYADADRVWEDRVGDRFKFKNGSWHVALAPFPNGYHPVYVASLLQAWGPYTVVEPRKVKSLTESERDAEWTFQGNGSLVFAYKWDVEKKTWMGTHTSDTRGPNPWDDIGIQGPILSPISDNYLVEVL